MQVAEPKIIYRPRRDATAEAEHGALAAVYRFILDCQAKNKGGPPTAPDDGKKVSTHGPAETRSSP